MITVYNLLEVDENASKDEIEKAYQNLLIKYHKDPKLSDEENNAREIILNKLKLAYDILSDDEKREKYNKELAKKRAEELIQNVTVVRNEEQPEEKKVVEEVKEPVNNIQTEMPKAEPQERYVQINNNNDHIDDSLTKDEVKRIEKAAKQEFKSNLKKAQKAEEEYNRAYNEAYNDYLRKLGYTVKEPWTLKRVKNLAITILAIIIFCILVWTIPFTRKLLIEIYEENFIIKSLVDVVRMLFNAIIGAFKG